MSSTKTYQKSGKIAVNDSKNKFDMFLQIFFFVVWFCAFLFQGPLGAQSEPKDFHEVILVHGTFASEYLWFRPGGDFYEAVKKSCTARFGENNFSLNYFLWSGELSCIARIQAASQLAEQLLKSPNKLYLFGHSHGATINILASIMLDLLGSKDSFEIKHEKIKRLSEALSTKASQEKSKWAVRKITEPKPETSTQAFEALSEELVRLREFMYQKESRCGSTYPVIEENIMAAAPIDNDFTVPSQLTTKTNLNIFSKTDLIQPIFGLYSKTFIAEKHWIKNFAVYLEKEGGENFSLSSPNHSEMHCPLIGEKLMQISATCSKIDFEEYKKNNFLSLVFYENKNPVILDPKINLSIFQTFLQNFNDFSSMFSGSNQ